MNASPWAVVSSNRSRDAGKRPGQYADFVDAFCVVSSLKGEGEQDCIIAGGTVDQQVRQPLRQTVPVEHQPVMDRRLKAVGKAEAARWEGGRQPGHEFQQG